MLKGLNKRCFNENVLNARRCLDGGVISFEEKPHELQHICQHRNNCPLGKKLIQYYYSWIYRTIEILSTPSSNTFQYYYSWIYSYPKSIHTFSRVRFQYYYSWIYR